MIFFSCFASDKIAFQNERNTLGKVPWGKDNNFEGNPMMAMGNCCRKSQWSEVEEEEIDLN